MGELKHVALKNLFRSPVELRPVDRESKEFIQLLGSIQERGIIDPIAVRPMSAEDADFLKKHDKIENLEIEGNFIIVNGLQRTTACRILKLDSIPAQVIEYDGTEYLLDQFIANFHSVTTKPAEFATQLYRIMAENKDIDMEAMSSMLSLTPATIKERLKLVKLTDDLQELVDTGVIPLMNGYSLASLPVEEQEVYKDKATTQDNNTFADEVKARKAQINKANREGRDAAAPEFVATAVRRSKTDLQELLVNDSAVGQLTTEAGADTANDGFMAAINYALSLDPTTLASKKEKFEKQQTETLEKREKRKEDAAKKKAARLAAQAEAAAADIAE